MPRFETNVNLNRNELQNARVQNLSAAPSDPVEGLIYFNTTDKEFYIYNGTAWKAFADASGTMVTHGNEFHTVPYEEVSRKENTTLDTSITNYPTVGLVKTNLDLKVDKVAGKGLSTEDYTTAEKTKLSGIVAGAQPNAVTSVATRTGAVVLTKDDVGLSNVENKTSTTIRGELTSANVTSALTFTPENSANKGAASGYAGLDGNGKIPLTQLPDSSKQQTYVVANPAARLALSNLLQGDKSFETSTGDSYIWNGTAWLLMSDADWANVNLNWANIVDPPTILALGEANTNAYRGDRGKTAYDHSQVAHAPSTAQKNSDITKAEIEAKLIGEITTHTHPITSLKYAANVGNGTLTSFVITHSFNTRDVAVTVRENAAPFEVVYTDIEVTSADTITIRFAKAPTTNQYRVIVLG